MRRKILMSLLAALVAATMVTAPASEPCDPDACGPPPCDPLICGPGGGKGSKNDAKCEKVRKPPHVHKCHVRS